ncbi:MAG: SH3 domain-containing protein [Woeseia sp.]
MRAALVVLFALGLPVLATADAVVPLESVQDFVNIRAEPSADSDVIGRLYQGDSMPLVRSIEGWYEIRIEEDFNGFISADWTSVITEAEERARKVAESEPAGPAAEPAPAEEPEGADQETPEVGPVRQDPPEVREPPVEESEVEGGPEAD